MRLCLRAFQRNQTSKIKTEPRVGSCNRNTRLGWAWGNPRLWRIAGSAQLPLNEIATASLLRIASGKENVHDAGHASEEDLIDLKDTVDRHEHAITEDAIQIAALKSQIADFKDGIRELIDPVEDLATPNRNGEMTLQSEHVA